LRFFLFVVVFFFAVIFFGVKVPPRSFPSRQSASEFDTARSLSPDVSRGTAVWEEVGEVGEGGGGARTEAGGTGWSKRVSVACGTVTPASPESQLSTPNAEEEEKEELAVVGILEVLVILPFVSGPPSSPLLSWHSAKFNVKRLGTGGSTAWPKASSIFQTSFDDPGDTSTVSAGYDVELFPPCCAEEEEEAVLTST
jgi:hypothetical protein